MEIKVFKDLDRLATFLAQELAFKMSRPGNVGFAAGKTMDAIYAALRAHPPKEIKAHAWMLDEYLGLSPNDPQTFGSYLAHEVFAPLKIDSSMIHKFELVSQAPESAAKSYEEDLKRAGSLDLQLLGIGLNGHVGLNEPGSKSDSVTRVVEVAEKTRVANQSTFRSLEDVPKLAITMGIQTILNAKDIWLIATGEKKAEIIKRLVNEPPSSDLPASLLKHHSGFKLFLDESAAKFIK